MRKFYVLMLALLVISGVFGQTKTITGTITGGDTKETLPGVSVIIEGTTTGTMTDLDGKYKIDANVGDILVYSFVGYLSEKVTVQDQSEVDMILTPDIKDLDEVVVIGYGVQKKSLVTGSIAKVSSEDITRTPVLRAEQAIQGRTSGVTVSQSSGQPGSGFTVRVRGTGSNKSAEPLYIIDGMSMGGIESLNPNDIESIEILKDAASAAIYGSRGANGVVLITTKKGKKGEPKISYKYYHGFQEIANKKFEVMNSDQYLDYRWKALLAEGKDSASIMDPAGVYKLPLVGDNKYSTDWIDEVFSLAPMSEHNITVTGGNEKTAYVVSGSYFNQDGIAGGDKANFNRYTARFNFDHQLKDWLSFSHKANYIHSTRTSLPENNVFNSFMNRAINMDPLTPVFVNSYNDLPKFARDQNREYMIKGDNGLHYGISDFVTGEVYNPLAATQIQNGVYTTDKIIGSLSADVRPFAGFTYTNKLDYELAYGNNESWSPRSYFNLENDNPVSGASKSTEIWKNWQWGHIASYDFNVQEHNFNALGGIEMRNESYQGMWASTNNLYKEVPEYGYLSSGADSTDLVSDAISNTKWLSYFGRINYNYQEKYLASLIFRADGSSLFGPENRFGYFPSASLGWVVSREQFWNLPWMNFLKVRASWGQNGSTSNLGPDQWRSLITSVYQYPDASGVLLTASEPEVNENPNLKWETSEQTDIGFDMAFLDNRITFNADYYRKVTKDLLTKATSPAIYGNYNTTINAGNILNTGVEFEVGYKYTKGDLNLHIDFNAAYNYNEVLSTGDTELLEGATIFSSDAPITYFQEGYPVWYYSGYVTDGIFQTDEEAKEYVNVADTRLQPSAVAGDVKFVDLNKDGVIDKDDRTMLGDPHPNWILGTNISVDYKNFDFSMFWQGAFGQQVVDALNRSDRTGFNKPLYYYENAWDGEGSTNDWFRPTDEDPNGNFRNSDLFITDASFLRLKNIQVGYNIGNLTFLKNYGISNARIYASIQNALTITKYRGLEPEIGAAAGDNQIGIDYGFYPTARIYQIGFNVTF